MQVVNDARFTTILVGGGQSIVTKGNSAFRQFFTEDAEVLIPENVSTIFVTMTGGGGAGGPKVVQSVVVLAGGGGGGAESCVHFPLTVGKGAKQLSITIGQGGTASSPDGTDSQVLITTSGSTIFLVASGGEGGMPGTGGDGGNGNFHPSLSGQDGVDGEGGLISGPPVTGGNGGFSFFSSTNANYGKGGKGESSSMPLTNGSDGFVTIEW